MDTPYAVPVLPSLSEIKRLDELGGCFDLPNLGESYDAMLQGWVYTQKEPEVRLLHLSEVYIPMAVVAHKAEKERLECWTLAKETCEELTDCMHEHLGLTENKYLSFRVPRKMNNTSGLIDIERMVYISPLHRPNRLSREVGIEQALSNLNSLGAATSNLEKSHDFDSLRYLSVIYYHLRNSLQYQLGCETYDNALELMDYLVVKHSDALGYICQGVVNNEEVRPRGELAAWAGLLLDELTRDFRILRKACTAVPQSDGTYRSEIIRGSMVDQTSREIIEGWRKQFMELGVNPEQQEK